MEYLFSDVRALEEDHDVIKGTQEQLFSYRKATPTNELVHIAIYCGIEINRTLFSFPGHFIEYGLKF